MFRSNPGIPEQLEHRITFNRSVAENKELHRAVIISPQVAEVLWEQERKAMSSMSPSPNGGLISPSSINNMFKRALEGTCIQKIRFYDLRHAFTINLQDGVAIKTMSSMQYRFFAGFALDIYAHVTTSAQKK